MTVRLLGPHAIYVDGDPIKPGKRGWELLILLLLRPSWSAGQIRTALGEKREADNAKLELRKALGAAAAGEWLDGRRGQFGLTAEPDVDYNLIRWENEAKAFDYCIGRGDLLPAFAHIGVVADERERYHQKLYGITRNLIVQQTTVAEVAKLRQEVRRILPPEYLDSLPSAPSGQIEMSEREDNSIEATLRTLEAHVLNGAVVASDAGRLMRVIDQLSQTAYRWRLASSGVVERVTLLVHALRRRLESDLDSIYVKMANLYCLSSNLPAAVETLRPWLSDRRASANAFCTAALYNLDLAYITHADACFGLALTTAPTPDFRLTVQEKRTIQLANLRGEPYAVIRRAINDAAIHPAFHLMSPGARASVWCNAARAEGNPAEALRLTEKGRQIDSEAENPHYEIDLLRYARAANKPDLAKRYAGEVRELMQVRRPASFRYTQMSLHAEQLVRMADEDESSPHYRARLEEAAGLWDAIYEARRLRSNVPGMCRALLRRADLAKQLREFGPAYEYATTAYLLSGEPSPNRLRYATEAGKSRNELESRLDYKARRNHGANGQAVAQQISRPHPLVVPQ